MLITLAYLARHNLGVATSDLHACIQASPVVSLHNIAAKDLVSANAAVVWALGTGVAALGPAEGRDTVAVKESVLLQS